MKNASQIAFPAWHRITIMRHNVHYCSHEWIQCSAVWWPAGHSAFIVRHQRTIRNVTKRDSDRTFYTRLGVSSCRCWNLTDRCCDTLSFPEPVVVSSDGFLQSHACYISTVSRWGSCLVISDDICCCRCKSWMRIIMESDVPTCAVHCSANSWEYFSNWLVLWMDDAVWCRFYALADERRKWVLLLLLYCLFLNIFNKWLSW